jgi:hypothetical protein
VPSSRSSGNTRDSSKYASVLGAGSAGAVSYSTLDGNFLRDTVESVTSCGDAILFGRTSDGGALSVQLLSGGVATKFYPSDASQLYELCEGIQRACSAS